MLTRRKNPRTYVERLNEASFTGNAGINTSKSPTTRDNVFNALNTDVALDGGLTLRKPLIKYKDITKLVYEFDSALEDKSFKVKFVKYLYDKRYQFVLLDRENRFGVYDNVNKEFLMCYFKMSSLDLLSEDWGVLNSDLSPFEIAEDEHDFNFDDLRIINTPTSSILTGVYLDINYDEDYYKKYKSKYGNTKPYRYLKLTIGNVPNYEGLRAIIEVMTPEDNYLNSTDTIVYNPNTTLDYTYSLKDNLNADYVSVEGILAYAYAKKEYDSYIEYPEDVDAGSEGVEGPSNIPNIEYLTEANLDESYKILETVPDREPINEIILKAFLNLRKSDDTFYICLWEKTFNGVDWETLDTDAIFAGFARRYDVYVPDVTTSEETLTSSDEYLTLKRACILDSTETDYLYRPDCLPIVNPDRATYRFSMYSIDATQNLLYTSKTVYIDEQDISYDSLDDDFYINEVKVSPNPTQGWMPYEDYIKNPRYPLKQTFNRSVEVIFESPLYTKYKDEIDLSKFSIHISYKDRTSFLNNTPKVELLKINEVTYKISVAWEDYDKVSLEDTFIKTIPTIIKIFYKDTLYCTLKELYVLTLDLNRTNWNYDNYTEPRLPFKPYLNVISNNVPEQKYIDGYNEYAILPWEEDVLQHFQYSLVKNALYLGNNVPISIKDVDLYTMLSKIDYDGLGGDTYWNMFVDAYPPLYVNFTLDKIKENITKTLTPDGTYGGYNWYKVLAVQTFGEDVTFPLTNTQEEVLIEYGKKASLPLTTTLPDYYAIIVSDKGTVRIVKTETDFEDDYNFNKYIELLENGNLINVEIDTKVDFVDPYKPEAKRYNEVEQLLDSKMFTFTFGPEFTFLHNEYGNTIPGKKLYYKKAIYSYGLDKFKNNIFPSYTGSAITPLFNVIDLDASSDTLVTTLIPWRDYLIAATEKSIYLITKQDEGYLSKTINTFIGIPNKDSKTCKAILNGIVFKSGDKIYSLQPNLSSSDDTILNISEISNPIKEYIKDTGFDNFAFTTEEAYYLFIPNTDNTLCIKYEYARKLWTKYTYPVQFTDYDILDVNTICMYDEIGNEYYFNKELAEVIEDKLVDVIPYGDYIETTVEEMKNNVTTDNYTNFVKPIPFYIDSGQKTNNLSTTKQFVESKIMLATLHEKDKFPFSLDIAIDGASHPVHIDVHTDSALWKDNFEDIGTLTTNFTTDNSSIFNTLRQMMCRYSGKGKSIRHIISGQSYFNFKFYVLYYRYKDLNIKQ